jgi:hypothetical protein
MTLRSTSNPPADLDVISLSNDVTVATFQNAILVHYRGETLPGCVEPMRAATKALAGRGKIVFFAVIELTSVPPEQPARRALTRFFEESNDRLSLVVITYRGEGFRGAAVRLVVQAVMSLAPSFRFAFPKHVVGSLEEAAALAQKACPSLDRAQLITAFDALSRMNPP